MRQIRKVSKLLLPTKLPDAYLDLNLLPEQLQPVMLVLMEQLLMNQVMEQLLHALMLVSVIIELLKPPQIHVLAKLLDAPKHNVPMEKVLLLRMELPIPLALLVPKEPLNVSKVLTFLRLSLAHQDIPGLLLIQLPPLLLDHAQNALQLDLEVMLVLMLLLVLSLVLELELNIAQMQLLLPNVKKVTDTKIQLLIAQPAQIAHLAPLTLQLIV
jgi:hypothetical protein